MLIAKDDKTMYKYFQGSKTISIQDFKDYVNLKVPFK